MDQLTTLSTTELQDKRATLRSDFRAQFAWLPKYLFSAHPQLRRDRNQALWQIRRVDRELRKRETEAVAA